MVVKFYMKLIEFIYFIVKPLKGNNLPIKHYETGDGFFFQLIVAIGTWSISVIVNIFQGSPKFYG